MYRSVFFNFPSVLAGFSAVVAELDVWALLQTRVPAMLIAQSQGENLCLC